MGKKLPVAKTKGDHAKPTKVNKESSVKKKGSSSHRKQILMMRRRISVLLEEKDSWEAKNRELIDNFNREKKLNAELQKDMFNWQRLYHEAIIAQNAYKVKHADIMQNVSSCLKDIKTAYPHLVGLSDTICRNQIKLTNLINSSHTFDTENHLPRAFGDGRQNSDLTKKSEKRMKHKVGPMVNGVLIQKPTIRLERVMLHQPQDQESANNDLASERGNALTPITEENEQETDLHLEHISIRRRRKHRLGTGERWRMKKQQEQLEKERQMERERERESLQRRSVIESSDSEDQLGPVIRLQRVSGLLLSPKLLEVDRGRTTEGKGTTSRSSEPENRRLRTNEDPKEGCSWMHLSPAHSKKKSSEKRKPESSDESDSSDEESDSMNVVAEKTVRNSLSSSLYKSNTFTMKRKSSSSSSMADTSHDVSDSSKVEPDSTNNIEDVVFARASGSDSLSKNNSNSLSDATLCANRSVEERGNSNSLSDATLCVNRSVAERGSLGSGRISSGIPPVAAADATRLIQDQRRSSSFCNNCTPVTSPGASGKRIRKPKNHLYPGEEPENAVLVSKVKKGITSSSSNKVVHGRLSAGRKMLGKRSAKNSLESSLVTDQQPLQGSSSGSPVKKKKAGRPKKSSVKKTPFEISRISVAQRLSEDQDTSSGSSVKKKTAGRPKKSSVKKTSFEISRISAAQRLSEDQGSEESDGRNSRRNRSVKSYKEPPVNVKMRRPK